jgi:ubiquinone/menaquinone biosynthesis C-methylase UbiE
MKKRKVRSIVREGYGRIAEQGSSCCSKSSLCCQNVDQTELISKNIGYSEADLKSVPEGANLGLGCGNPVAISSLKLGETVLDLGAGAGFDCFLAAKKVGDKGKVIGVDMTPQMIEKARRNARKGKYKNVEFRLGEIENLPIADNEVDVVISNCVINLSDDKAKVFKEAFRVLKQGGRLVVSDIVLLKKLPDLIKDSVEAYVGCLAGAIMKNKYLDFIEKAGFHQVEVVEETNFPIELMANDPTTVKIKKGTNVTFEEVRKLDASVVSIKVSATKPLDNK